MDISQHEYLLPIILGNGKDALSAARKINKSTGVKVHLFASGINILQRAFCICHTVDPMRDVFILDSLLSFLGSVEEYYCPVIIICDQFAQDLVDQYSNEIECACLVVKYGDFFTNESKGGVQE